MTKPMLIRQSPMTRRWYAFTNYEWLDAEHNALVIKGQKRDVTGEIERIIAEVEEQIKNVSTGEANGWISVEDSLPNDHEPVLFFTNEQIIEAGSMYEGVWRCERTAPQDEPIEFRHEDERVTHWQHFPKPPAPTSVPQAEPPK